MPQPITPITLPNPLRQLHQTPEAQFIAYDHVEIVNTFGQPQAEYAAIRKSCALLDLPQRGILEMIGEDRLSFLNNLLTNQTWDKAAKSGMAAGQALYAFFLNVQGRIVADMTVLELGDRTLLEMDGRLVEPVRKAFDKFLFAERVKMTNRIGALHQLALIGPGAAALLRSAVESGGDVVAAMPRSSVVAVKLWGGDAWAWRDDPCGVPGYNLILPIESAAKVWTHLVARFGSSVELGKRALRPCGWAAFNSCRIEGGRPIFGIDFTDAMLPAETGQFDRAVSVTKGCYLGQEVVARMYARKALARQVVGIKMESDALPIAGERISDQKGEEIGVVTSSTLSPVLSNTAICLAILKRPNFAAGTNVRVSAEEAIRNGTVVPTPFV